MNCKPGDLAMYVGIHSEHRGKVVLVVKPAILSELQEPRRVCDTYWVIEPKLGDNYKCADSSLRPLRHPGDAAKDETIEWLPSPSCTKEVA